MPKYQIEFSDGDGCASYAYFETAENIGQAACDCSGDFIKRSKPRFSFQVYEPYEIVTVREYDKEKKEVKPGGHQFKLKLRYFEDENGNRDYFYECKKAEANNSFSNPSIGR